MSKVSLIVIAMSLTILGVSLPAWAASNYSGPSGNDHSDVSPGLSKGGLSSDSSTHSLGTLDSDNLGKSYKEDSSTAVGLSQGSLSSSMMDKTPEVGSNEAAAPLRASTTENSSVDQEVLESTSSQPIKGGLSKEDAIAKAEQWAETSNPPMSSNHSEPQAVYLKDENAWIVDFIDANNAEFMLRVEATSGKDPDLLKGSQVLRYKSYFDVRK